MTDTGKRTIPWPRIFAEGVVIAVSILLALAANAWWDGVLDRRHEREYLGRLITELEEDSLAIERTLHFGDVYRRSASQLIDVLEGADSQSAPTELMHMVAWAGYLTGQSIPRATFDEMVSTGALGLIRDSQVTEGLVFYYQLLGARTASLDAAPIEFVQLARRSLPPGLTSAAQDCMWTEWFEGRLCREPISADDAGRVLELLAGQPNSADYLREVIWFADDAETAFRHQLRITSVLRFNLAAALRDECPAACLPMPN